jgi:radical SAM superfamily enzyme YgiQ (UPF0313 family)
MAKIYILYADIDTGYFPSLHHGLASLAASIRKNGHTFILHHLFNQEPPETVADKVLKFNPDIVGFSITTNQRKYLEKYSKAIYYKTKALQIVGGVHATIDPEDVFNIDSISGVCLGEAEQTLLEVLKKIDRGESVLEVNGFWWRTQDGAIRKNLIPPLDPDLSKLPYPDYSDFKVKEIIDASSGWMSMMVTRGCPFDCSYCCNHVLRSIYPEKDNYVRLPPVEYAIDIIKNNLSCYQGIKGIIFADDLLLWNKEWFREFAEQYRLKVGLPFICNARVEFVTEEMGFILKQAGCTVVYIGVESGNEWQRRYLLNRKMSNGRIINAFQILKNFGIQRFSYNILAFPFETKELMLETLYLNRRIKPEMGIVFYFFPFPGTRLYSICKEFGLLNESNSELSGYLEQPAITLTHCTIKDCKKVYVKLRLYLLSRMAGKNLRFFSDFFSTCVYILFSMSPMLFVRLFTKRSKLKNVFRKIWYKNI